MVLAAPFAAIRAQERIVRADPPEVEATVRAATSQKNYQILDRAAEAYIRVGKYDVAKSLLEQSLEIRGQVAGQQSVPADHYSVPGTKTHPEARLTGRERTRLRLARENGYLDARCAANRQLVEVFSRWCWRLKIPMVYQERLSPRSRYGRVLLDMFTTPHALTPKGQADLNALAPTRASPHDACWDRVPLRDLDPLANTVFRAATRAGNYQPNRPKLIADIRREQPGELFAVA